MISKNLFSRCLVVLFLCFFGTGTLVHADEIPLTYRLKWLFNASVAGDIMAKEGGFFSRAGLDVTIKEGSPEKNAIKELELGQADFGVASADQVIRALDKGAKVMVLAQIFQINPMQWIYRTENVHISQIADLKKYRVGITFGGNDETIMKALLAHEGLDFSDVHITGVRFDFTPFLKKKVDVWPVYQNSQGVILQDKLGREGETVEFLNPASFGIQFVANCLVTSQKLFQKNPELVSLFTKTLLQGWETAMAQENEKRTVDEIRKKDTNTSMELCLKQLTATRNLVKPDPKIAIGHINKDAFLQTEKIMLKEKLISSPVHIEKWLIK